MASSTPNINLTLPVGSEHVSRQIINDNFTKIDTAIGAVPSGQNLQGEVDALNNNINYPQSASSIKVGGVFGNYVTGYGCKIFLPVMKAANYNITITDVSVYGMTGDKSSYMQTPAKYGNGIEVQCTEDFSGKYATITLSVTEI